jgi:hypothetical protein
MTPCIKCGGETFVKSNRSDACMCRYCFWMLPRVGHESWLYWEDQEKVKAWKERLNANEKRRHTT